jgi:hypothetical protein
MPTTRITFHELPSEVRARIEQIVGSVDAAKSADEGLNSAVAARLETARGNWFIKALPAGHRWVWTQQREAAIGPHLPGVAPEVVDRIVIDDWDVVVFKAFDGSHADYTPGSPDLPLVVALLERIAATPCPPGDVELRDAAQRLQGYIADPTDLRYFGGEALLHTDLNNANVLVGSDQAVIVDWGWATRGAPWLDAAYWVVWLIAAGHDPDPAEQWAGKVSAWADAPPAGVTAFAEAQAALWAEIGGATPDPWTARLVTASARWAQFRRNIA